MASVPRLALGGWHRQSQLVVEFGKVDGSGYHEVPAERIFHRGSSGGDTILLRSAPAAICVIADHRHEGFKSPKSPHVNAESNQQDLMVECLQGSYDTIFELCLSWILDMSKESRLKSKVLASLKDAPPHQDCLRSM